MGKYNPSATIRARHITRTVIKDGKEVALEMEFTPEAWKHLASVRIAGKIIPKQGFVIIGDAPEPPEVKKPVGEKSNPASQNTGAAKKEAAKVLTPEAPKPTPSVNIDEVEAAVKADEKEKLPMPVLSAYVAAKGLDIPNADKMPQHELIALIKSLIAE